MEAMLLLDKESELQEIARLVGVESLSLNDRLTLESARSIREDFLHQNAFHPQDSYTSLRKQYMMLRAILHFHHTGLTALEGGVDLADILKMKVREIISKVKFLPEDDEGIQGSYSEVDHEFKELLKGKE